MKTPVGCSSSSGMMALNMPMQPSSKTPMMALSALELSAQALRRVLHRRPGSFTWLKWRTWVVSCSTAPAVEPRAQAASENTRR